MAAPLACQILATKTILADKTDTIDSRCALKTRKLLKNQGGLGNSAYRSSITMRPLRFHKGNAGALKPAFSAKAETKPKEFIRNAVPDTRRCVWRGKGSEITLPVTIVILIRCEVRDG